MSGQAALSELSLLRLLIVDNGQSHEVFEVISIDGDLVRVRSAFLFEIGEELTVQLERDGSICDAIAQVHSHVVTDGRTTTELTLSERTEPRRIVSG
ncbi:MAG: hypothetical protein AB7P03_08825 [Kofleriaceae bacterium]